MHFFSRCTLVHFPWHSQALEYVSVSLEFEAFYFSKYRVIVSKYLLVCVNFLISLFNSFNPVLFHDCPWLNPQLCCIM